MVLHEITPLSEKDCLYIIDRQKSEFTYPVHCHDEMELNFVEHAPGAVRIVGDSVETIGEYDLVLIGGKQLEHTWSQGTCKSGIIREITIQFQASLFSAEQLGKTQFSAIREMLTQAEHGIAFPTATIVRAYATLEKLVAEKDRFQQYLTFLYLLNFLAQSYDYRVLASSHFAHTVDKSDSRRIGKVTAYIDEHVTETLRQPDLAKLVDMSPSAFSAFFKSHTGRTLSEYIIDAKLGLAGRLLVDSSKTIAEICYDCGFNNLSNFNRIFKAKRGCTPREFRTLYKKNKILV